MKPITLILPFYLNQTMLDRQLQHLAEFPQDLRENLHLIVVDDGSPQPAVIEGDHGFDVQLYRFDIDIRWGWLQARNLGVDLARTKWVLLTDIDHLLPEATARKLMTDKHNGEHVYRFERSELPDLTPYKPHPNSWFISKALFDRFGGYDERFLGFYGTDCIFRDALTAAAEKVVMLPVPLWRVPREVIADASTTTYGRKEEQDRVNVKRIRAEIARLPPEQRRPARANHPWRRVR